jgi:hypothetical protein
MGSSRTTRRRRERPLTRKMNDPVINESVRTGLSQECRQIPINVAQAYCSNERATNENTNGLLRQYFPEHFPNETDVRDISHLVQEAFGRDRGSMERFRHERTRY